MYPDRPAPYFHDPGAGGRGEELERWAASKAGASDAVIAAGGTITHTTRRPRPSTLYDRQRRPLAAALRGAKAPWTRAGCSIPAC